MLEIFIFFALCIGGIIIGFWIERAMRMKKRRKNSDVIDDTDEMTEL